MPSLKQHAFTGGEISPELFGRQDLDRYGASLKTCLNFIVRPAGGAVNRPGTKFVNYVRDSSKKVRLIPFKFSNDQAYILEFGENYIRFHKDGGTVLASTSPSTGTHTGAGPTDQYCQDSGAPWTADALIGGVITNIETGAEGRVTDNTTTQITAIMHGGSDQTWNNGDRYSITEPYEVVTTYTESDLELLDFAQKYDVLVITHPDFNPKTLTRTAEDDWTLANLDTDPDVNEPDNVAKSDTHTYPAPDATHPSKEWEWMIHGVNENGEESSDGAYWFDYIPLYLDKPTYKLTWDAPSSGDTPVSYNVYRGRDGVYGFVGSTKNLHYEDEGYQPDYSISPPERDNPFSLVVWADPSNHKSVSWDPADTEKSKGEATEAYNDTYFWNMNVDITAAGAWSYSIQFRYKLNPGDGWTNLGTITNSGTASEASSFAWGYSSVMDGMDADAVFGINVISEVNCDCYVTLVDWWEVAQYTLQDDFPSVVTFFEQRLVLGNFTSDVQRLLTSKTGTLADFDKSIPPTADRGLDLTLSSDALDEIRGLVAQEALLVFTASAEWLLQGVQGAALSANSYDGKPRTTHGSALVKPLKIGPAAIFVPERGTGLREWTVEPVSGQSADRDLAIMAKHLFEGKAITELAYAREPFRCLWAIRDDGMLLGLTFLPEHQVIGWHKHITGSWVQDVFNGRARYTIQDLFESVASIPEDKEHYVYVAVNRTIDGSTVRTIERFTSRQIQAMDLEDVCILDDAISYDGRHAGATTMTLSGGPPWILGSALTLTASVADTFTAQDVGKRVELDAGLSSGTHDGGDDSTDLEDSGDPWTVDELIGGTVTNLTTGAIGQVTDNTAGAVTAKMLGGIRQKWNDDDEYEIDYPSAKARVQISGFTSGTVVSVVAKDDIPSELQGSASDSWGWALNVFRGFEHLEGRRVALWMDGSVHESGAVVSSGVVQLGTADADYGMRVTVGLPYHSDLEGLETPTDTQVASASARRKIVTKVTVMLEASRGIWSGQDLEHLREWQQRSVELGLGPPTKPESRKCQIQAKGAWRQTGSWSVRVVDPVPVNVLSVIPRIEWGEDMG